MALALIASMVATASVDVYSFTTSIKFPDIGKTSFVPASLPVTGTLTIDYESESAPLMLEVTVKRTKTTYVLTCDDPSALAVFGKKNTDFSTAITFVNVDPLSDGILSLTFSGMGSIKTKTTGTCTPCCDTTQTCSKIQKMSGVVIGAYACPCGGNFIEWDGSCEIDPNNKVADYCTIYGKKATLRLKTVDGKKW